MDLGLEGKTAFVGAAGGGLGRAICYALLEEGVKVIGADVNADALEGLRAGAGERAASLFTLTTDFSDLSSLDGCLQEGVAAMGEVDILVNITGGPPPTPAVGVPITQWRDAFDAMVAPVISLTNSVIEGMRDRGWGRIVTSASSGVVAPIDNLAISNGVRSALVGWSKTLSNEVARDGVTVNVVVPGRIATQRIKALDAAKAERESRTALEVEAESTASIPAARYGDPAEYADVVAFLASERASYMNGTIVRVDGGLIRSI